MNKIRSPLPPEIAAAAATIQKHLPGYRKALELRDDVQPHHRRLEDSEKALLASGRIDADARKALMEIRSERDLLSAPAYLGRVQANVEEQAQTIAGPAQQIRSYYFGEMKGLIDRCVALILSALDAVDPRAPENPDTARKLFAGLPLAAKLGMRRLLAGTGFSCDPADAGSEAESALAELNQLDDLRAETQAWLEGYRQKLLAIAKS